MVAIKAGQAQQFAKSPPEDCCAVLVYGSDVGLVSELCGQVAKAFAGRVEPAGEIIRMDDADLEQESDRLTIELQTLPMFGGPKVVRATMGRRINAAALKAILDDGPPAAHLVVEAGNLRPTDAARKAFESHGWSAALACYSDDERDLSGLISDMVAAAGRTIERDASAALLERLGADRALSRGEIEKLILYVGEAGSITIQDVDAIVGDASELATDQIVAAAAQGDARVATRELDRSVAGGDSPQMIIAAMQRHFRRLHRLRSAMDQGKSFDDAARQLRPPIFFKQRQQVAAECRIWPTRRLQTALQRISEMAKMARRNSQLEATLAERLLLEIATMAKRSQ